MTKNKIQKNNQIALALNVIVILMELVALALSISKHGWGLFEFYTEDSNLLALVVCTIFSIALLKQGKNGEGNIPRWIHILKFIAACCLTVTFVVVIFVLAPSDGMGGLGALMLKGSMLYHHFLCPILVVISFLFFEKEPELNKKTPLYALIPTVIYAIVAIILNICKVIEGPYPFLRVYDQPVYMSFVWGIIILGGNYLFALLIWKTNKKMRG